MSRTVTLLRPFTFSRPAVQGTKLPTEQKFSPRFNKETGKWIPTEVELPDDMFDHPFISEHFADGCIERPEAAAARVKVLQERLDRERAIADRELQRANEAFNRSTGAHQVHQAQSDQVATQINTPVNELQANQGRDIGNPINNPDLEDALNTPVNVLQTGKTKSGKKV